MANYTSTYSKTSTTTVIQQLKDLPNPKEPHLINRSLSWNKSYFTQSASSDLCTMQAKILLGRKGLLLQLLCNLFPLLFLHSSQLWLSMILRACQVKTKQVGLQQHFQRLYITRFNQSYHHLIKFQLYPPKVNLLIRVQHKRASKIVIYYCHLKLPSLLLLF